MLATRSHKGVQIITQFIVTNYGPNWFNIKSNPACTDGPKHVHRAIQFSNDLPQEVSTIVRPYITRNAYFAHPENVLLAMLADSSKLKREKATNMTMKLRKNQNHSERTVVREFRVPNLLFDATDWDEIIDWTHVNITESPLTRSLTDKQIQRIKDIPLVVQKYPNHTQNVERSIKLVSEASKAVYGFDSRDGFIRARIKSRTMLPQCDTKKDFACTF